MNLLIYVYADEKYSMFAMPYVYFALKHNPSACVEICFDNLRDFLDKNKHALSILEREFPGKYHFRQATISKSSGIIPNTIRFIDPPELKSEYLYIGDIDLLILDDIMKIHTSLMKDSGLSYSNIIRKESVSTNYPRLSGLHFCYFDDYFPLPDLSDIDLSTANDEFVLYEIMRRKGVDLSTDFNVRPECGIHMSLSRTPTGYSSGAMANSFYTSGAHGWGGRHYYEKFINELSDEVYIKLSPYFDLRFRILVIALEAMIKGMERELHKYSLAYLCDRRLLTTSSKFTKVELYEKRSSKIRRKEYEYADMLGLEAINAWPFDISSWFKMAWLAFVRKDSLKGVQAILHIFDLPGGVDFVKSSGIIESNITMIKSEKDGDKLLKLLGFDDKVN
ncbi:hypothetical protein [Aeromonas dhakensis]|uniref:hypothetical protein n=1 Tax=Aeromonas dhakensis TaxID=196024 RepID=UPI003F7AC664